MNRRQADVSHGAASLKEQRHVVACVAGWARFALGGRRRVVGYRPPIGAGDRFASFVMASSLRFARRGSLGQAGLAHAGY